MIRLSFVAAALLSVFATSATEARTHIRVYRTPMLLSYSHNYGPGPFPGTYAYYDGPATNSCRYGAASYRGQDRRRHPCN